MTDTREKRKPDPSYTRHWAYVMSLEWDTGAGDKHTNRRNVGS